MDNKLMEECEKEISKKFVLWGLKIGDPEHMEEILLSECTLEQAETVIGIASNDGYANFRTLELDNSKPNFISAINL